MKSIIYTTPFSEIRDEMLLVRRDLDRALESLDALNIGNARACVEQAQRNLPEANDQGYHWMIWDRPGRP